MTVHASASQPVPTTNSKSEPVDEDESSTADPTRQTTFATVSRKIRRLGLQTKWHATAIVPWVGYQFRRASFKSRCAKAKPGQVTRIEEPLGSFSRHVYDMLGQEQMTTFQLDQHWRLVSRLYPQRLTSLLDIGCCRGWFTLQAAQRPECERAVGVDLVPGFIDSANRAKDLLHLDHLTFHYAFLNDLTENPGQYQVPVQTILLLNVYHYLFWGSYATSRNWPDHDYLLGTLAGLCTDRLILTSPLTIVDCPGPTKQRARQHPDWTKRYNPEAFLEAANRYFHVTFHGHLGTRPLYLMRKR